MKIRIILLLSLLIILTLPFACQSDKPQKAISSRDIDTSYLTDYQPYPGDPDSVVRLFYKYLDQRKFRLAYQFVDPKVFGTFDYFSSIKGFGNTKHINIKKLEHYFSYYVCPCDLNFYFVQLWQTDIHGNSQDINVFLKVESKDNLYKITDFSIIPRTKDDFRPERFFKASGDVMSFPETMRMGEQHEFYGSWQDTNYYVHSFFFDVYNIEEQPIWNFVFIYKQIGKDYVLSNFYFGANDLHNNTLFNTAYSSKNYFLLETTSGGRGTGGGSYSCGYYTPWMQNVLEILSDTWSYINLSEKHAFVNTEDYVDSIKLFEKGKDLFLRVKFNSEFTIYYDSPRDTVCGENSCYRIYKFDFNKMKFSEYQTIGDTTNIGSLVSDGHFEQVKKYRVKCKEH